MPSAHRLAAAGCLIAAAVLPLAAHAAKLPRPDHVLIVIEENKSFDRIIAKSLMMKAAAPYINALAARGALFTDSHAITHPSEPNYLALFSGSSHGMRDDRCPLALSGPNLAAALLGRGFTFATYSESMPGRGFKGCFADHYLYARKHNPVANWSSLPDSVNLRFEDFPRDFARLPTVALVIPNQLNDMHNGRSPDSIRRGDAWLESRIGPYIRWARSHNSLFILTWDEDDLSSDNHIATLFVGPMVRPGRYGGRIDHYSVLRTLTDMYGLPPLGEAAKSDPITGIWRRGK